MISSKIKKNILDLQYSKYTQYYITTIIIFFTYVTGIFIAIISDQITSRLQVIVASVVSFGVILILLVFVLRFRTRMHQIMKHIVALKEI